MNRFLTILTVCGAIAALTTSSFAQGAGPKGGKGGNFGGGPGQGRGMGGGRMMMRGNIMEKLNLTAAQKQKIEAIQKKYMPQIQEAMQSFRKSMKPGERPTDEQRKAMRAKMKPINDKMMAEINKVLTPAQQKQLKQAMEEQRKKMEEMRAAGGPGGRGPAKGAGGKGGGKSGH